MNRFGQLACRIAGLGAVPKILLAVTVSATAAGAIQLWMGAESTVVASAPAVSDRVIVDSAGPGCSQHSWPYYEARCLRAADGLHPQTVRIITADRQAAARH